MSCKVLSKFHHLPCLLPRPDSLLFGGAYPSAWRRNFFFLMSVTVRAWLGQMNGNCCHIDEINSILAKGTGADAGGSTGPFCPGSLFPYLKLKAVLFSQL